MDEDGILLIDKPAGISSADVVRQSSAALRSRSGTSGRSILRHRCAAALFGEATKIAQFLNTADKRYEGSFSSAGRPIPATGPAREVYGPVPDLAKVDLAELARRFVGEQWQTPPMYSP